MITRHFPLVPFLNVDRDPFGRLTDLPGNCGPIWPVYGEGVGADMAEVYRREHPPALPCPHPLGRVVLGKHMCTVT